MGEATMSGRPRKFKEPSRPVTVTLPERTLDRLERIDSDRARAIVKAVDGAVEDEQGALRRVDVIEMAPGTGLLVVPATRTLAKIPWLKMIEISPAPETRNILPPVLCPPSAIKK
jgi:hypothetical protein